MNKTIWILAIALVLVVGSITTGTMAFAAPGDQGKPFEALQAAIDDLQDQIDNISAGLTVDSTTGDVDVANDLTVAGSVTVGSTIDIDGVNNKITGSAATELATTAGVITIDPGDNGLVLTIGTDGTIDSASIDSTSIVDGSIEQADLSFDPTQTPLVFRAQGINPVFNTFSITGGTGAFLFTPDCPAGSVPIQPLVLKFTAVEWNNLLDEGQHFKLGFVNTGATSDVGLGTLCLKLQ